MKSTKPSSLSSSPSTSGSQPTSLISRDEQSVNIPEFSTANTYVPSQLIPDNVCPYDFLGYCKKKRCHLKHLKDTCHLGITCSNDDCRETKRHPKLCKWYQISRYCKLGINCQYSHLDVFQKISELTQVNKDLKNQIIQQNEMLTGIKNTVDKLSAPVNAVDEEKNENILTKIPIREEQCDQCGKFYSSKSGLTRHKKSKHPDTITPAPASPTSPSTPPTCQSSTPLPPSGPSSISPYTPPASGTENKETKTKIDEESSGETCIDAPTRGKILRKKKKKELSLLVMDKLSNFYSKPAEIEFDINSINPTRYIMSRTTGAKYKYHNEMEAEMIFIPAGLSVTLFYTKLTKEDPFPAWKPGNNNIEFSQFQYYNENQGFHVKIHQRKYIMDGSTGAKYKYDDEKKARIKFISDGLSVTLCYNKLSKEDSFPVWEPGDTSIKFIQSQYDDESSDEHQAARGF